MEKVVGTTLASVGQRVWAFLFGTRQELSAVHRINAEQSTILAQIQQDVRAGFSGQVQRIDKVELRLDTVSQQVARIDAELDDIRDTLSQMEKEHRANHSHDGR